MLSIAIKDYLKFFLDLVTGARTRAELSTADRRRSECVSLFDATTGPLEVLDVGNGAMRPQMYILANQGHNVTGVDFVNGEQLSLRSLLYRFARWAFRLHLPRPVKPRGAIRLVKADVSYLPFPDRSFDLITSCAAFEHFLEVDKVVAECHRVLKPGGKAWILIHSFTSLSGGHNVGRRLHAVSELPDGVEPWDHLRAGKLPIFVPLNRYRASDYRELFKKHFHIIDHTAEGKEGENLLTAKLRDELSAYSEEELTRSTLRFVLERSS